MRKMPDAARVSAEVLRETGIAEMIERKNGQRQGL